MNRISIIQQIFTNYKYNKYLEIGCQSGVSFLPIRAKYKIAVDPKFRISFLNRIFWIFRYYRNAFNKYFEEESDVFFNKRRKFLEQISPVDVVLIDGLHTFKTSLNDVLNSLKYLNKDGYIIMHDCLPPHKAAAIQIYPNLDEIKKIEGWTGEWCGEVWKTIIYLKIAFSYELNVTVLKTDCGLGIIRQKKIVDSKDLNINYEIYNEINKLNYDDLMGNLESFLELKEPQDFIL